MKIGTHSGAFHADETFAIATLLLLYPNADVVRTRDPEILATCDILVDVGGVYDSEKGRFDHHFDDKRLMRENGVKFSSFGLVWKHFGSQYCRDEKAAAVVDRKLVQGIDALDNGQGENFVLPGVESASLALAIDNFNPTWIEVAEGRSSDDAFENAVNHAQTILYRASRKALADVQCESAVLNASAGGESIVVLNEFVYRGEGWEPVAILADQRPRALFCVFLATNGEWSAQAVPPVRGSREQRKSFPAEWNWKRGAELAAITGVEDAIFSHGGRWFACAKTKEGAIALATLAMKAG